MADPGPPGAPFVDDCRPLGPGESIGPEFRVQADVGAVRLAQLGLVDKVVDP